jgi:pimeloyl-ACP methyl ester carboxylesterase
MFRNLDPPLSCPAGYSRSPISLTSHLLSLISHLSHRLPATAPLRVGHGMGSWIALLVAKKRPDLVAGIVGLSPDPDFTENLLWKNLSSEDKDKIMQVPLLSYPFSFILLSFIHLDVYFIRLITQKFVMVAQRWRKDVKATT